MYNSPLLSSNGSIKNPNLIFFHLLVVESLPFGGVGESGMGNYHGKNSFDSFSHKKGCVIKKQAMESFNRYSIFFFIFVLVLALTKEEERNQHILKHFNCK